MCENPSVKTGVPTILCLIVVTLFSITYLGCQGVTEPPGLNGTDGVLSGARSVHGLPVETGPIITLTNEYMDPVVSPVLAAFMKIPDGIPVTFCWTVKQASGGGAIEAYRYGWDVFDPGDPDQWDMDLTAYDGEKVCSAPRSFSTWGVHLFTVEVIDDAGANTLITIAVQTVFGPPSFDVMPGPCRNPLSTERKGQIRTVVPGRIGLGVSEIDVSSLYLWVDGNVVEPLRTRVRDIASPMINRDPCDCAPKGRDGLDDLEVFFAASDIIRALGPVSKDEIRQLQIHGDLLDGDDFVLTDCVVIVGTSHTGDDPALFDRDAVLVTLQKGYNEKDFQKVSAIFDNDFTFFFSEEDILSGNVPFSQWGRDEELTATANLFNLDDPADATTVGIVRGKPGRVGATEEVTWGKIKAAFFDGTIDDETFIGLVLIFPQGEDNWIAVVPPDPTQYPGETWYEKTAMYYLTVQAGEIFFITPFPLQASFVVRFSENKGYWQLVQWRDDI